MAIFSNQATLTYDGVSINSNIAFGEIIDALAVTKTAIEPSYTPNQLVTYVVTLRNVSSAVLTNLTVTDNLGGFDFEGDTVYPLTYEAGSAALFVNGTPATDPTVTAGPPLVISGIRVPANSNAVIVYQARANAFANPDDTGSIVNTVSVTGGGLTTPITATETVPAATGANLSISKSITPAQVIDNQRVTYTFVIQNFGNQAIVATDGAVITDTFNPILADLAVALNGNPWTQGTQYTYNEATGLFATTQGAITVPAATFTQDSQTGEYTVTPGTVTLTVIGTI